MGYWGAKSGTIVELGWHERLVSAANEGEGEKEIGLHKKVCKAILLSLKRRLIMWLI